MINHFCKKPLWECSKMLVAVAQGQKSADVVIKGARLINVCTAEIQENTDVAIVQGRIAYVGNANHCIGQNTQVIEANGAYIAPGFIDGHIHVESSMLGAGEFARAVVPHGTVGIMWDPHEICNVLGLEGVKVMESDAVRTPLKAMVTTPSCVPGVPGFEDTGASIDEADIAASMDWETVVGLGEMMNFPGVLAGDDAPFAEIAETLKAGKIVTGHYSLPETDRGLNGYIASGARCCHESTREEDALAKMRLGMYAQLRYGSAWKDLPALAGAIARKEVDSRFAMLVTDDAHPHTLVAEGHLDRVVRKAISLGIDAITAIQMVSINCAQCFQLDHDLGSITPGKCADIVFLDNLEDVEVTRVLIDGELVAEAGAPLFELEPYNYPDWVTHSMHIAQDITPESFVVSYEKLVSVANSIGAGVAAGGGLVAGGAVAGGGIAAGGGAAGGGIAAGIDTQKASPNAILAHIRAIEVMAGKVGTREVHLDIPIVQGKLESDISQDVLKTFVFERHHETGRFGCGFVKGFGIKCGAMASTVAHDAHNLLVMGTNDDDMALAANELINCGGGMVVVKNGEVLGKVELAVAGLMAPLSAEEASAKVHLLERAWQDIGCSMPSPFMTMALIPLACLPELRLTDRGLVDCTTFQFTSLLAQQ